MSEEELSQLLDKKLAPVIRRIDSFTSQRFLLLVTTTAALLAAVGAIIALIIIQGALAQQISVNREYGCASARTSAASPAMALPGEGHDDFIERLIARRAQLVQAGNLNCSGLPGYSTFPYLRGQAIIKIDRVLADQAPARLRQIHAEEAHHTAFHPAAPGEETIPSSPPQIISGGGSGPGPPASHGGSPGGSGPTPTHHPPSHGGGGGGGGSGGNGGSGGEGGAGSPGPETPVSTPPTPAPAPTPAPTQEPTTSGTESASSVLPLACETKVLGKPLLCIPK